MPTLAEITAATVNFVAATAKALRFINGATNESVTVESGTFPSFPKALTDFAASGAGAITTFNNNGAAAITNFNAVMAGSKLVYVSKSTLATNNRAGLSKYSYIRPFATIAAAIAAAVAGEMVVILDGTYDESGLAKNGVNLFFYPGTLVSTDEYDGAIFPSTENNCAYTVYGFGTFHIRSLSWAQPIVSVYHSGSKIEVNAYKLLATIAPGNGSGYGQASFADVAGTGTRARINFDTAEAYLETGDSSAQYRGFTLNGTNAELEVNGNSLQAGTQNAHRFTNAAGVTCYTGKLTYNVGVSSIIAQSPIHFNASGITSFIEARMRHFQTVTTDTGWHAYCSNSGTVSIIAETGMLNGPGEGVYMVAFSNGNNKVKFNVDVHECRGEALLSDMNSTRAGSVYMLGKAWNFWTGYGTACIDRSSEVLYYFGVDNYEFYNGSYNSLYYWIAANGYSGSYGRTWFRNCATNSSGVYLGAGYNVGDGPTVSNSSGFWPVFS